ncbi:hypothetical protein TYRP_022802, partial [Tyrophagus putrescentiae]
SYESSVGTVGRQGPTAEHVTHSSLRVGWGGGCAGRWAAGVGRAGRWAAGVGRAGCEAPAISTVRGWALPPNGAHTALIGLMHLVWAKGALPPKSSIWNGRSELNHCPDLVLITVFKMLTPNEQMVASEMSPRCSVLVRAANRTVKTLVITDQNFENPNDLDDIRAIVEGGGPATIDQINYYSLASKPAMHPLMSVHGEPSFPDYPMTTHLSKWHCLEIDSTGQIDTATIEQITTIFSAVTDLKFMTIFQKNDKHLVTLLQHPNWQCQLTSLMVYDMDFFGSQVAPELITTAINDLTSLKQLALDWRNYTDLPDLTILGQLKVVAFRSHRVGTFVRSLEQYATDNADLQVHLFSSDSESLLSLSQPLHSRIVHFGHEECFYYLSMVRRLCSQFRFLTSLNIGSIHLTQVGPLFTVLSQLHQLVHLNLEVFWQSEEDEGEEELPAAPRPLAQMNSLRALELRLNITFHSQVEWLNLPVTMPNLQTIHIQEFCCESCKNLWQYVPINNTFVYNGLTRTNVTYTHTPLLYKEPTLNTVAVLVVDCWISRS